MNGGQFDAYRACFKRFVKFKRDGIAFACLRVAWEFDRSADIVIEDVVQTLLAL